MRNRILWGLSLLALSASMLYASGAVCAKNPGQYKFIVNYGMSFGGESASKVEALLNSLSGVINKKTGIKISMLSARDSEEAYEKLKSGEADFGIIRPMQYARAVEEKAPLTPLMNLAINKKQETEICVYANKKTPVKMDALRGKRVMLLEDKEWIYAQQYLADKGTDEKLTDYFSKTLLGDNPQSALYTLVFKKADAAIMTEMAYIMAVNTDKRFNEINKMECMGKYPVDPLVFRNDFDKQDAEKIVKMLVTAHKDPDFKDVHIYFVSGQAFFTKVKPDLYKDFRDRVAKAKKNGWLKDFEKWRKTQGK